MSKYKISKELFEAVYKETFKRLKCTHIIEFYNKYESCITLRLLNENKINETKFRVFYSDFAFDCKQWAFDEFKLDGFEGKIETSINNKTLYSAKIIKFNGFTKEIEKIFYSDSAQQAVFDACQWLIEKGVQHD